MHYVDINICIFSKEEGEDFYTVNASTTSTKNEMVRGRFQFLTEEWQSVKPILMVLEAGKTTYDQRKQIREFGKYLFNCLINGDIRQLYDNKKFDAIKNSKNPKTLRLRLTLKALDLVILPWEILYDERDEEYLCLMPEPKLVLIRSIEDSVKNKKYKHDLPLRILGMIATSPNKALPSQAEPEKTRIDEALQQLSANEQIHLEWKPGTVSALNELQGSTDHWDIFHFIGYGRFSASSEKGQGQLAFENEENRRRPQYVPTERICASLTHMRTKVVVLSACETSQDNRLDRLSNIAHSFATPKIPAVVAMQFNIPDTASNTFTQLFYTQLAQGIPIDEAVAEARRKIITDPDSLEWAAPILYISTSMPPVFKTKTKPLPPASTTEPPKVFLSCSHCDEDQKMLAELVEHLAPLKSNKTIISWHHGEIGAGKERAKEIEQYLNEADIILLLVSPNFLASDYYTGIEMKRALERHSKGEARVIPILLRPAHWEVTPLRDLRTLPTGDKPITEWASRDAAFLDVARGIQKVIDELTTNNLPVPPTSTLETPKSTHLVAVTPTPTTLASAPLKHIQTLETPKFVSPIAAKPTPITSTSAPLKHIQRIAARKPVPFWISVALIWIIILGTVVGVVWHSLTSSNPLTPLCSGNFQSANVKAVPTPATSTSRDGEPIGLSEGVTIFDLHRPNQQEVQYKLQAAQAITTDPQNVVPALKNAISSDPTDAEAQIYLENWQVLQSKHSHITFVVGVSFASLYGSGNILQGAFTAQKECNDQNTSDDSRTQVVLMIANIGGDDKGNTANESAKFVADQIVDQASKDPTIVGIMGWPTSAATEDVQTQLNTRGSHLPILAACSGSDALTGKPHFFRVCPVDTQQAQVAANFVLKTQQKKRIAILYQSKSSWPSSFAFDFKDAISKAKANAIGPEDYITGDQDDIQRALKKVYDQKPDAIFFSGYPSDLVILLNAISSSHYDNLLIMGGSALSVTDAYPNPFPDLHNVYFTSYASIKQWDNINPKPPFFQEYWDNFGTLTAPNGLPSTDAHVMLAYDGMSTLLRASGEVLSTKNSINASDLEGSLNKITVANPIQGVTGLIAFDSNGNQGPSKMIVVEHIDGTNLVIDETHGCLLKDKCSL